MGILLLSVYGVALKLALPQDKILKSLKFFGVDQDLSQQLIDKAEQSIREWDKCATCFLNQPQQKAVTESFKDIVDLKFSFQGGYMQAENRRVIFERSTGDEEYATLAEDNEDGGVVGVNMDDIVAMVNIEGNFLFEKAAFTDFKSALTQCLGQDKGQVGDIILNGDRGAQVLMMPEHCETVCSSLKQILSVPVDVARRELTELKVRSQSVKDLQTVEASMRLDAIASAGFGYSRTKMVALVDKGTCVDGPFPRNSGVTRISPLGVFIGSLWVIPEVISEDGLWCLSVENESHHGHPAPFHPPPHPGMVQVDWVDVKNSAAALQIGQEVSVRGVGRLVIEDAQQTSKGRFKVKMRRYNT